MRPSEFARKWLRRPSRMALLVGAGALSVAGVRAEARPAEPVASSPEVGDATIRLEGGRIYLSEAGSDFRELALGDTAQAVYLKRLLADNPAAVDAAVSFSPMMLAGAGGQGFHWTPAADERPGDQAVQRPAGKAGAPANAPPAAPATIRKRDHERARNNG